MTPNHPRKKRRTRPPNIRNRKGQAPNHTIMRRRTPTKRTARHPKHRRKARPNHHHKDTKGNTPGTEKEGNAPDHPETGRGEQMHPKHPRKKMRMRPTHTTQIEKKRKC